MTVDRETLLPALERSAAKTAEVSAAADALAEVLEARARGESVEALREPFVAAIDRLARAIDALPDPELRAWALDRLVRPLGDAARTYLDSVELPWASDRLVAAEVLAGREKDRSP